MNGYNSVHILSVEDNDSSHVVCLHSRPSDTSQSPGSDVQSTAKEVTVRPSPCFKAFEHTEIFF